MDLSANLCNLKLRNPLILASGIKGGSAKTLKRVYESGCSAVITKSIGIKPREGYKMPTIISPMKGVIINAMGLPNPGYKEFLKELKFLKENKIPTIVSIFGYSKEEFIEVANGLEEHAEIFELNISCPHSSPEMKNKLISQNLQKTAEVVSAIKDNVKIPFIVKLSPNVSDISEFAKVSVENGASGISAINTVSALEIDVNIEKPILGNYFGGQSGESIKYIAQRKVAEILLAMERKEMKKVPVVGVGGISSGEDVIKFLLLGCTAVEIGSAIHYYDLGIFKKCENELKNWMKKKGYKSLNDFRGKALKELR